jgi:hypothetical protein
MGSGFVSVDLSKDRLSIKPLDRIPFYPGWTHTLSERQVIIDLLTKFHRELSQFAALVSRSTSAG